MALAWPGAALAHKPLFLDGAARSPLGAPRVEDGTVSYAAYGRLDRLGDRRYLLAGFEKGDRQFVELLLPDRAPERDLPLRSLPRVVVRSPAGQSVTLVPTVRERFYESVTGEHYIRLLTRTTAAAGGAYTFAVVGPRAARFCLVIGTREQFGAGDLLELPGALLRIRAWFRGDDNG